MCTGSPTNVPLSSSRFSPAGAARKRGIATEISPGNPDRLSGEIVLERLPLAKTSSDSSPSVMVTPSSPAGSLSPYWMPSSMGLNSTPTRCIGIAPTFSYPSQLKESTSPNNWVTPVTSYRVPSSRYGRPKMGMLCKFFRGRRHKRPRWWASVLNRTVAFTTHSA
jgi:hypothetical protein